MVEPTGTSGQPLPSRSVFNWSQSAREGSGVVPGTEAPDFDLADPEVNALTLSDLRGKVVVINFWASWVSRAGQKCLI